MESASELSDLKFRPLSAALSESFGDNEGSDGFSDRGNSESQVNSEVELVFVDTSVADYAAFENDIRSSANERPIEVFLLDGSKDGIAQVSEVLLGYDAGQVEAMHIISHGSHASVELGSTTLNSGNLSKYREALSSWSEKFTKDGDLLLYGCLTGKDSSEDRFIDQLSDFTGADVAASEDITGNGGDWDLEATTGTIEAEIAVSKSLQARYQSTLQTMYIADDGQTDSSGVPLDANGNVINNNNQNPQFDLWGKTITDASITVFSDLQ